MNDVTVTLILSIGTLLVFAPTIIRLERTRRYHDRPIGRRETINGFKIELFDAEEGLTFYSGVLFRTDSLDARDLQLVLHGLELTLARERSIDILRRTVPQLTLVASAGPNCFVVDTVAQRTVVPAAQLFCSDAIANTTVFIGTYSPE